MKKLLLTFSILGLLAVGCSSQYTSSTKQTSNNPTSIPTIQQQVQTNFPSGWQVDTNTTYDFKIAYPSYLKKGEYCMNGEVQNGVTVPTEEEFSCLVSTANSTGSYLIMVANQVNNSGGFSIPITSFSPSMHFTPTTTPENAFNTITQTLTQNKFKQLPSTTISGLPVIRFTYAGHDFWYFIKNNILWDIELTPSAKDGDLRTQILNTLIFY